MLMESTDELEGMVSTDEINRFSERLKILRTNGKEFLHSYLNTVPINTINQSSETKTINEKTSMNTLTIK